MFDLASATPATSLATLNNPGPELPATTDDEFGRSVAMSGNWMIVGAYRDDTGRADAASAFVYNLASATPTVPVHQLRNPQTPFANDAFGYAVAMDGQRFVVGAHNHNGGAVAAGGAYVYDLTSSTPTYPVLFLNNPAPEAGDNFGFSVAISGTRVVVGAWLDATCERGLRAKGVCQ